MTYINQIICKTHIIYITHIVKLIFKTYKKMLEYFLQFFSIYKNANRILSKKTKEKLSKKVLERHRNLSDEKKNKKRQYARERYRNFSEEEKQKKHQYDIEIRQHGREQYKKLLEDEKQS